MKKLALLFSALLLLNACGESSEEEKEPSTTDEVNVATTDSSANVSEVQSETVSAQPETASAENMLFPFGKTIRNKEPKTHEYGSGDCYGIVRQFWEQTYDIGIDTMECSEYTKRYGHYLWSGNNLQKAHFQSSSILFDASPTAYAVSETVYNFTTSPTICKHRTDTINQPDFSLITAKFNLIDLEDEVALYDSISQAYNSLWKQEKED